MKKIQTYTPKRLQYVTDCGLLEYPEGDLIFYEDYKELSAYADKLAEGLPCLPKDIEVLRNANTVLARRVFELEQQLKERN
jgi:hypothetical protein